MGYNPCFIANEFIKLAERSRRLNPENRFGYANNYYIPALVLQKMVFVAHGYVLALLGHPLSDENPKKVREYGADRIVFPSLDEKLSVYGVETVMHRLTVKPIMDNATCPKLLGAEKEIIEGLWVVQEEHCFDNDFWTLNITPFLGLSLIHI